MNVQVKYIARNGSRGVSPQREGLLTLFMALAACLLVAQPVTAQRGGGSSGLFGSRSVGSSINAGSRNTFGGGAGGASGTAGSRIDQIGSSGQLSGSERFLRQNRQAGQFVGTDSADNSFVGATTSGGALTGGLTGGLTGLGGAGGNALGFGAAGGGNRGRAGPGGRAAGGQTLNIRMQLKLGFTYPRIPVPQLRTNLQSHLPADRLGPGTRIDIQVAGSGVVVLRGTVPSSDARRLAVQVAHLEPGVREVRDELQVVPATGTNDSAGIQNSESGS